MLNVMSVFHRLTSDNGGDPDGVKSHALDVVELGLEAGKCTAAVLAQRSAGIATGVIGGTGDTVGQGKVDVAALPCGLVGGESQRRQRQRRGEECGGRLHGDSLRLVRRVSGLVRGDGLSCQGRTWSIYLVSCWVSTMLITAPLGSTSPKIDKDSKIRNLPAGRAPAKRLCRETKTSPQLLLTTFPHSSVRSSVREGHRGSG